MLASVSRRAALPQNVRRTALYSAAKSQIRYYAKTNAEEPEKDAPGPSKPYVYEKPTAAPETWLATYLKSSPKAMKAFQAVTGGLGINNPRQQGGRISYHWYQATCASREVQEREFWHKACKLPPTFQTWFTVTNLHVWLLTVRFRALPSPYGENFVQGLIDHFFMDVEDRIRQALSRKAPERLVSRQMKILREQWVGLGLSLDYAIGLSSPSAQAVAGSKAGDSDTEMAAAVWRNFLGARGAQGVADPGAGSKRHAVNISGEYGKTKLSKEKPDVSLRVMEEEDDGSGIYDFTGEDVQLYVKYPELMLTLTAYIRRELVRLEKLSDEEILNGEGVSAFGNIVVKDIL